MLTQHGVGAALVAGASAPVTDPQARVQVLRAFLWGGEVREAGSTMLIAAREARQLVGWGKVEVLPPEDAKPEGKAKAKTAEAKEG